MQGTELQRGSFEAADAERTVDESTSQSSRSDDIEFVFRFFLLWLLASVSGVELLDEDAVVLLDEATELDLDEAAVVPLGLDEVASAGGFGGLTVSRSKANEEEDLPTVADTFWSKVVLHLSISELSNNRSGFPAK